ncbi:LysR family transcriptional regulator [Bacillus sp. REN3]|uniref:LysR family transcriptional regulator n=1 Tax=Bacillus sp. REN3 TaxID=2802440 RepID=UPI001AEDCFDE|nr:LysR family transcriptional regulator [Bacillus sp. REN3]
MNLLAFRYFLEIARSLNFSKASKNLHISQPGLSQQISGLENELGFKLLNRSTRKVTLTEEGEYLFQRLSPSFEHIDSIIRDIKQNQRIPKAVIKIASVPSAASNWVPALLKELRKTIPELEFFLQEVPSTQGIELVQNEKCHLAFIRTPLDTRQITDSGLKMIEFTRFPLEVIVSEGHVAGSAQSVDLYNMRNETFIHYDKEASPSLYSLLEHACRTAGFVPNSIGGGPEILTIANLVSNNLGITIMPRDMFYLIQSFGIKALTIKGQQLSSSISVIWKESSYIPLVTKQSVELIRDMTLEKD